MCFVKLCIYKTVNSLDYINNKSDSAGDSIDHTDASQAAYVLVLHQQRL